jgi:hypothetical protein
MFDIVNFIVRFEVFDIRIYLGLRAFIIIKEVSKDELDMIIKAECLPIGVLVVSPKPRNIK